MVIAIPGDDRAVQLNAKILIPDAPTVGLDLHALPMLARLTRQLQRLRIGIFRIESGIPAVMKLCCRVSVMRHGLMVGTITTQR